MYYTEIKHDGHSRTLDKRRKHSPAARVFYIFLVFSNDHRVLSQCNTRLRLLYLLNNQFDFFSLKLFSFCDPVCDPVRGLVRDPVLDPVRGPVRGPVRKWIVNRTMDRE